MREGKIWIDGKWRGLVEGPCLIGHLPPKSRSSNRIAACACIPGSTWEYVLRVNAGS